MCHPATLEDSGRWAFRSIGSLRLPPASLGPASWPTWEKSPDTFMRANNTTRAHFKSSLVVRRAVRENAGGWPRRMRVIPQNGAACASLRRKDDAGAQAPRPGEVKVAADGTFQMAPRLKLAPKVLPIGHVRGIRDSRQPCWAWFARRPAVLRRRAACVPRVKPSEDRHADQRPHQWCSQRGIEESVRGDTTAPYSTAQQ